MKVVETIEAMRRERERLRGSVGFVPTMGFLHEGHLSLMRRARELADHLVVSIFVNPTQFGPDEDLEDYPRDVEGDRKKCEELGCEVLFMPDAETMYHDDHATTVRVPELEEVLCGPQRPGHFAGVCTVVSKLFHIVEPDVAVFGQKDYQQLAIIRRMTRDLNMPVDIVGGATVREEDGLAISSRNKYLDDQQRRDARCLSRALRRAWKTYREGERDGAALVEVARQRLLETVDAEAIDYVECVHPETLARYEGANAAIDGADGAVLATAVQIGRARLIDNLRLDKPLPETLK
ncbi:MAG: pantoate--beta-alanine ligase [Persicimonas sp.]